MAAAFGRRLSEDTTRIYVEKLALHFNLPEDAWTRASSRMVADLESFPPLSVIYKYLGSSVKNYGAKTDDRPWVTFQLDGKPHAIRCRHIENPPLPPENATDSHLVIPPQQQIPFSRIPISQARDCFSRGYLDAGGKPEELGKYFTLASAPPTAPRPPMWYDDKEREDEAIPAWDQ